MANNHDDHRSNQTDSPQAKTVQQYIDESPIWADGTKLAFTPMTAMQWRIWWLASAGKFFEGLVVFMTGVALPLIVKEFGLDVVQKGAVSSAALFGILVGATALGGLADRFGRRRLFIVEMIIFTAFLLMIIFANNLAWLLVCLFGMGLALGCDYPTAHMVISESIPSRMRGKLVLSAFGFQALGALAGTAVGYLILQENPSLGAWRWMYGVTVIPAALVLIGRFFIPDSGHWLVSRDRIRDAETEILRLLTRKPPYPKHVRLIKPSASSGGVDEASPKLGYRHLFSKQHRRAAILASVPWFLQDLGTYGIGIFTPTILASVIGHQTTHARNLAEVIHNDMLAAKGAAFVDLLLLIGIIGAVFLADRAGRIRLQVIGFIGCAAGLVLATLSLQLQGESRMLLLFGGFMLFNFMTNLGPNAMTYLIAGEVFPTHIRGKGAGLAASFAKIGAVCTAFLFPILLKDIGVHILLFILTGTSLLGAVITKVFAIETKGVSLEDVGDE